MNDSTTIVPDVHPGHAAALIAALERPFGNVINGIKEMEPGERISVLDPYTGNAIARVSASEQATLDRAVQSAEAAFAGWSSTVWSERSVLLEGALSLLRSHAEELINLLTLETGRPKAMAAFEIDWILNVYGPQLLSIELKPIDAFEEGLGVVQKRFAPLGVVAAISPWNLPFWLSFTKVLPAMLAGNTVVLKPAVTTPLTALRGVEILQRAIPAGVLNVITGGDELGPLMTSHPGFQKVSFTGSSETGRAVSASAAPTLKHLTLELGGNDPGIVLPDASPNEIAEPLFRSMFTFTGQGCITLKRLIVHDSVYEELASRLVSLAESQRLGDGFDEETTMGPVQNRRQYERLVKTWDDVKKSGAKILFRGEVPISGGGLFYPITLLDNPPLEASFVRQENFGPIRSLFRYSEISKAVRIANGTSYGLGASVWGKDTKTLREVAQHIEAGIVWVNQHLNVHPNVPMGGVKASGTGAEFGEEGLKEFCSVRVIAIRSDERSGR